MLAFIKIRWGTGPTKGSGELVTQGLDGSPGRLPEASVGERQTDTPCRENPGIECLSKS